jgi:RNA polymerase sigma-70 factor (ECF subfamily)
VNPRAALRTDAGSPASPRPAEADAEFRELFRAHFSHVWRSLRALGVGEADTGDACQQVFLVLHSRLDRWDRSASLRAYVYGICLRVASDYRRRAHRRHEQLFATPPDVASDAVSPEVDMDRRRELAFLDRALNALPARQREVFVLFEIEELDMSEIAAAVGCPLFTAYSRLRAARKAIAARMDERGQGLNEGRTK